MRGLSRFRSLVVRALQIVQFVFGPMDRLLSRLLSLPKVPSGARLIGHRGAPLEAAENSLEALAAAIHAGVDGVEIDLLIDKGRPLVAHDFPVPPDAPQLLEALLYLRGHVEVVYVHYKADNHFAPEHVDAVSIAAETAGMAERLVVMVEDGRGDRWLASRVRVLNCWSCPPSADDLPDVGIYHHWRHLSFLGRLLSITGMRRLGAYFGFGPIRRLVASAGSGRNWVVFTIDDPFLARLYLSAGVLSIGTDDPRSLRGALTDAE